MVDVKSYSIVTASYWGFTITDGALRMLVLLHFHGMGFRPVDLAFLFILYEMMGVITNLFGGWIGAKYGLKITLYSGLALQVFSLTMLSFLPANLTVLLSVIYVMASQALSGVAKDLTKMSSKSAIKYVVPENNQSGLFKWVSLLTGSKNALKGAGFFVGALLLQMLGFQTALLYMAAGLFVLLVICLSLLSNTFGKIDKSIKFREVFSKSREINFLSAARVFLFASRDVWFVVGVPVFLVSQFGWNYKETGAFMACWVIGYGIVQAIAPKIIKHNSGTQSAALSAKIWGGILCTLPIIIVTGLMNPNLIFGLGKANWLIGGLIIFGFVFAINSAIHSYLIVGYADRESASLNIGFYYMANAVGRCLGTFLSGAIYQFYGLSACLIASTIMIFAALVFTLPLNHKKEIT